MDNIFTEIPQLMKNEFIETILQQKSENIRIERIVSRGHKSPTGFVYNQDENEWVIILKGRAKLSFVDSEETFELSQGDYLNIAAHVKHRVEWTAEDEDTVWLAIFY